MSWKPFVVSALCVLVASCTADDPGNNDTNDQSTVPETVPGAQTPEQPAAEAEAPEVEAPRDPLTTPVNKAIDRHCLKQDDCPVGLTCVAHTTRILRCEKYDGPAVERTGPEGRPVPPVGLLDGTALRAEMGLAQ